MTARISAPRRMLDRRLLALLIVGFFFVASGNEALAAARIGELDHYKFETFRVSDRILLRVNVSNGNLVLRSDDLVVRGRGLDMLITRYYNGLDTDAIGNVGKRWTIAPTRNNLDLSDPGGSVSYRTPSSAQVTFTRNTDGSYTTPTGLNATLMKKTDDTFELRWHRSGTRYNFSTTGLLTSMVDMNDNQITVAYAAGRASSITDTQSRVAQIAYVGNLMSSITDSSGRQVEYQQSSTGLLVRANSQSSPGGINEGYFYDSDNRLTEIITPESTAITYDTAGRVATIVRGSGIATTTFAYNTGNTVVTDPRGKTTTHFYDGEGRVTKVVDANGKETLTSYTSNSNVATATSSSGAITQSTYDANNNLSQTTSPTGFSSSFGYSDTRHPFYATSYLDPQGNTTSYAYDVKGNVVGSQNALPSQNQLSFTYNSNGTLATTTDAKGAVTSFSYDANGNLTGVDNPSPLGDLSFVYDGLSRVTRVVDGKGQATDFTYDGRDRITTITYAGGAVVNQVFDRVGNLVSQTGSGGAHSYAYDALNRLTSETVPTGTSLNYNYDAAGNLLSYSDDSGFSATYVYNNVNLVTGMTQSGGGGQTTFAYNDDYSRTATNYPNGVSLTATYDSGERLLEVVGKKVASGAILTKFTYSYTDAVGVDRDLRQSVTDKDGNITKYTYDVLNRLTRAQTKNSGGVVTATFDYTYDGNSNRTSQVANGQTTNYSYNAPNQLTAAGTTTYSYDANGNLISSSTGLANVYNVRDQTVSAKPAGGSTTTFEYDGPGQYLRTKKDTQMFVNSQLGISAGEGSFFMRDNRGVLVGQRIGSNRYYYLFDGLGSVAAVTDSAGNVSNTYSYDPFGKQLTATGSVGNPWRFTAAHNAYWDSQTGLYKIGARYYDPNLGRWTQRDPLTDSLNPSNWNNYVYVGNDPVNLVDPLGTCSVGGWNLSLDLVDCAYDAQRAVVDIWKSVPPFGRRCIVGGVGAGLVGARVAGKYGAAVGAGAGCVLGATNWWRRLRG